MRIIGGKFRSRQLRTLRGLKLRPTSDRLRETLFNVLTAGNPAALEGSVWLDLYAGSGAVGIEALSRGASMVYFVESHRPAAALIRANLRSLGVEDRAFQLLEREAEDALRQLDRSGVACGFCFLDPPYKMEAAYQQSLGFLSQSRLVSPTTIVIAEHDRHYDPGEQFGALQRYRKLEEGDAVLSFYRII